MHRRLLSLVTLAAMVVFAACSDEPSTTAAPLTVQSAAPSMAPVGVDEGFYFLPPLAEAPTTTGEFDAEVEPVVEICEWDGTQCLSTVATFDVNRQGAERVRADGSEGHYIVNWKTDRNGLTDGGLYRVHVSAEGVLLGAIDLQAMRGGKGKGGDTGEVYTFQMGRTIPIKFRIEVGAYEVPTATVVGVVTDGSGALLSGVGAALQGTAVVGTTNSAGGLTLDGIRTGRTAVLRLTLSGYTDQIVRLDVPAGSDRVTFRASLRARAPAQTVSVSSGGTVASEDGAGVTITPGSFVNAQGQAVSGDIQVQVTPVDVANEIEAFPGTFTGINTSGESGLLMTYGVAEFTFEQNGEELDLAPGETATIVIPIYTGELGLSIGEQIPLWSLDEDTGEWVEEALGTVVALASSPTGLGLQGEVTHFSWWNIDVWVDAPYEPLVRCEIEGSPTACTVRAQVTDPSFPRTNAESLVPIGGARLTFPPAPAVTELSGESGNRFGTVPGGVSGPSGGGATDVIVIDLANEGVISPATSIVTVSSPTSTIPEGVTLSLLGRDGTGAPMTSGGANVRFWVYREGVNYLFPVAVDNGDGTYTYDYVPAEPGNYRVEGYVNNQLVTTGDVTFTNAYSTDAARASTSVLTLSAPTVPVGGTVTATLQAYDINGNPKGSGGDLVTMRVLEGGLTSEATVALPVTDNGDGTYDAVVTGQRAGSPVQVSATVNFEDLTTPLPELQVLSVPMTAERADTALMRGFENWWWGGAGGFYSNWALSTVADVATSSWGNFGMRDLSSEPRQAFNNDTSYPYRGVSAAPWLELYSGVSWAYDVLRGLDTGLQIGAGGADTPMYSAAAKMLQGLAHGRLALMFDRAFILDESIDLQTGTLTLAPYTEVMDSALAYLTEAEAIATGNSFTTPSTWLSGLPLSNTQMAALIRSYRAQFRSAVARTEAERTAVDWNAVLSDASTGIDSDVMLVAGENTTRWWNSYLAFVTNPVWFRMDYRLIGGVGPNDPETDPDGSFAAWLNTPVADRMPFTSSTTDARIDNTGTGGPYITNLFSSPHRPERGTYHLSFYHYTRYPSGYSGTTGDVFTMMAAAEMDLLEAEARVRLSMPGAAALINNTRVNNGGLSPASDAEPMADLMAKLFYEKRMETHQTDGSLAYFDRRGAGPSVPPQGFGQGLLEGSPRQLPIPARELERLGLPNYTFGGTGSSLMAGPAASRPVAAHMIHGYLRPGQEGRRLPNLDSPMPGERDVQRAGFDADGDGRRR